MDGGGRQWQLVRVGHLCRVAAVVQVRGQLQIQSPPSKPGPEPRDARTPRVARSSKRVRRLFLFFYLVPDSNERERVSRLLINDQDEGRWSEVSAKVCDGGIRSVWWGYTWSTTEEPTQLHNTQQWDLAQGRPSKCIIIFSFIFSKQPICTINLSPSPPSSIADCSTDTQCRERRLCSSSPLGWNSRRSKPCRPLSCNGVPRTWQAYSVG